MWYHWRPHHDCKRFEVDDHGLCVFCRTNDELIVKGYEVIPFDMPGAYDATEGEPRVKLQSIRGEPDKKPS